MNHRAALPAVVMVAVLAACAGSDESPRAEAEPSSPTFAAVTEPPATFAEVTTTVAPTSTTSTPAATAPATTAPPASSPIDLLTVSPEGPRDGYDRDLFVHWTDEDGDGCDTRCEVLERERRADLAGLPDGGWLSVYDGYTTDDPSELDVDHVVALAEAWDSGAAGWDPARRRAFANDLAELTAVTASVNRSKSDRDPADWQPPSREAWCSFVARWVEIKVRWQLTADEAEVRALRNMLAGC